MFTVDSALQHTCAEFREQVKRGQITAAECDLLIDGAILLAIHVEALIQDARTAIEPAGPELAAVPHTLALLTPTA